MRYPLWAFFMIFVLPLTAAHALLSGRAEIEMPKIEEVIVSEIPVHYHRF